MLSFLHFATYSIAFCLFHRILAVKWLFDRMRSEALFLLLAVVEILGCRVWWIVALVAGFHDHSVPSFGYI